MKSRQGFTLIEALISISILILISGIIVIVQRDLFSVNEFLRQSLSIQRDSEAVLRTMISELRAASQSSTGSYSLIITEPTSLAFYTDLDSDSIKERVHYFLSGSLLMKSIVRPAGDPLTYSTTTAQEMLIGVLQNVIATTTPLFSYYDENYAGTTTPLAQPVNPSDVRLIGISISIDEKPERLPPPITVSSQVNIRNLRGL
jgi:type II secretory pathway pseudopilin PulG